MMYADPTFEGNIKWLTIGTAAIPQWRYNLAMLLAFPGVILYGAALFAVQEYMRYAELLHILFHGIFLITWSENASGY